MWIAGIENAVYTAVVRKNGQFIRKSRQGIICALFESDWINIQAGLYAQCNNRAAVALLDGNHDNARMWMTRAEKLKEIE